MEHREAQDVPSFCEDVAEVVSSATGSDVPKPKRPKSIRKVRARRGSDVMQSIDACKRQSASDSSQRVHPRTNSFPETKLEKEGGENQSILLKGFVMLRKKRVEAGKAGTGVVPFESDEIESLMEIINLAISKVSRSNEQQSIAALHRKLRFLPPDVQQFLRSQYFRDDTKEDGEFSEPLTPTPKRRDVKIALPREESVLPPMPVDLGSWNFNIFTAYESGQLGPSPMVSMACYCLMEQGCVRELKLSLLEIQTFFGAVEKEYVSNPYHNALHAADVTQTMHFFMTTGKLATGLPAHLRFAALFASLVHDVGHPALNNNFLIETNAELAIRYNDVSPLENYHVSRAFQLLESCEFDLLRTLSPQQRKEFRKMVIKMVLATDNAVHFDLLGELNGFEGIAVGDEKSWEVLWKIALHAADLSNLAKQWSVYRRWTDLLMQEFYAQGDSERELGMKVSPMLDRMKPIPMPKFQSGFINAIVLPLYKSFVRVEGCNLDVCLEQLEGNLAVWTKEIINSAGVEAAAISQKKNPSPPNPPSSTPSAPPPAGE